MTPRNVLRIIVATVGLLGIGYGIIYFIDGVLGAFGQFTPATTTVKYYIGRGIVEMFIGYLFMRNARGIANIAFPEHEDEFIDEESDEEEMIDDDHTGNA